MMAYSLLSVHREMGRSVVAQQRGVFIEAILGALGHAGGDALRAAYVTKYGRR
jgi:hypothetical protein